MLRHLSPSVSFISSALVSGPYHYHARTEHVLHPHLLSRTRNSLSLMDNMSFYHSFLDPLVPTFFPGNPFHDIHSSPASSSFWEPIYLSSLAGASTCLGASVAFLIPAIQRWKNQSTSNNLEGTKEGDDAIVGPNLLSFSLALAGSVMITVCVVSIIPECLEIGDNAGVGMIGNANQVLFRRLIGFVVGWGVYALLSQLLNKLPEEEEWGDMLGDAFSLADDEHNSKPTESFGSSSGEKEREMSFEPRLDYSALAVSQTNGTSILSPEFLNQETTIAGSFSRPFQIQTRIADHPSKKKSPWRLTLLLFLSLLLHNFPEGVAVSLSAASANDEFNAAQSNSMIAEEINAERSISNGASFFPSKITSSLLGSEEIMKRETEGNAYPNDVSTSILQQPQFEKQTEVSIPSSSSSKSTSSLANIVTLSIALHNIPEGIAICVPCLKARPNQPWLAFGLASLSGLAEPIGAFVALVVLKLRESSEVAAGIDSTSQDMGDALAFVAGIMMAVALFELIPEANRQRKECDGSDPFVWGIMIGVCIMVTTELYLG